MYAHVKYVYMWSKKQNKIQFHEIHSRVSSLKFACKIDCHVQMQIMKFSHILKRQLPMSVTHKLL